MASTAKSVLKEVFGHEGFRGEQDQIISQLVNGNDCLVLMPTGGGKSLCYQIPALQMAGTCLVISPLIALMKDQVDQLRSKGVDAVSINSTLPFEELRHIYDHLSDYKLIYISPERLENEGFVQRLSELNLSFIAVDEAHCISQWGHDFRPAYRNIHHLRVQFPNLPLIALTATATPSVAKDIVKNLELRKPKKFISGFDRTNLKWVVLYEDDKLKKLREIIDKVKGSGIIYASSRKNVEDVYEYLSEKTSDPVAYYHAGLNDAERHAVQDKFIQNQVRILVCTNAFGMGIDKPDVRFVVHYNMPSDLEAYYQEAGRAGRDGRHSFCVLFYKYADKRIHEFFIEKQFPEDRHLDFVYKFIKQTKEPFNLEWIRLRTLLDQSVLIDVLAVLAREKFIQANEDGTYTFLEKKSIQQLVKQIDAQRESAMERLRAMQNYAEQHVCRRNIVLDYFGESHKNEGCGRCDICLGRHETTSAIDPKIIRRILALINDYDERFGVGTFVDVLKGTDSKNVEKYKLYQHATFSSMASKTKKDVFGYVQDLIRMQYLHKTMGKYPLVGVSAKGSEFLLKNRTKNQEPK